jgi:hypothetical protein
LLGTHHPLSGEDAHGLEVIASAGDRNTERRHGVLPLCTAKFDPRPEKRMMATVAAHNGIDVQAMLEMVA